MLARQAENLRDASTVSALDGAKRPNLVRHVKKMEKNGRTFFFPKDLWGVCVFSRFLPFAWLLSCFVTVFCRPLWHHDERASYPRLVGKESSNTDEEDDEEVEAAVFTVFLTWIEQEAAIGS